MVLKIYKKDALLKTAHILNGHSHVTLMVQDAEKKMARCDTMTKDVHPVQASGFFFPRNLTKLREVKIKAYLEKKKE